jgi:hypothetical protein
MVQNRRLWAALTVIVGGLQALDSGALQAGITAQLLVVLGLAAPSLALLLAGRREIWLGALVAGAGLLVWARIVSIVPLNTLHIGLMVPAAYVFFVSRLERAISRSSGRRPGPTIL